MLAAILGSTGAMLVALVVSTWHLSGRITRIETRMDEADRTTGDRRALYAAQQRDAARAVCSGPHDCAYRAGGPNPRIRVYAATDDHDTLDESGR